MKAIPTDSVCLGCHGTDLSPDVSRILADLYPVDRATGYSEGDIRGAFVTTRKLSNYPKQFEYSKFRGIDLPLNYHPRPIRDS